MNWILHNLWLVQFLFGAGIGFYLVNMKVRHFANSILLFFFKTSYNTVMYIENHFGEPQKLPTRKEQTVQIGTTTYRRKLTDTKTERAPLKTNITAVRTPDGTKLAMDNDEQLKQWLAKNKNLEIIENDEDKETSSTP
jgi:hypothetical protein